MLLHILNKCNSELLFRVQIIFVNKKLINVIVSILMNQNFQFVKVKNFNFNLKVVTILFINKNICATPNKSLEPLLGQNKCK